MASRPRGWLLRLDRLLFSNLVECISTVKPRASASSIIMSHFSKKFSFLSLLSLAMVASVSISCWARFLFLWSLYLFSLFILFLLCVYYLPLSLCVQSLSIFLCVFILFISLSLSVYYLSLFAFMLFRLCLTLFVFFILVRYLILPSNHVLYLSTLVQLSLVIFSFRLPFPVI